MAGSRCFYPLPADDCLVFTRLYSNTPQNRKKGIRKLLLYFSDIDEVNVHNNNWDVRYNRNNDKYQMLRFYASDINLRYLEDFQFVRCYCSPPGRYCLCYCTCFASRSVGIRLSRISAIRAPFAFRSPCFAGCGNSCSSVIGRAFPHPDPGGCRPIPPPLVRFGLVI